jgi:hypothetical protein
VVEILLFPPEQYASLLQTVHSAGVKNMSISEINILYPTDCNETYKYLPTSRHLNFSRAKYELADLYTNLFTPGKVGSSPTQT